MQRSRAGRNIGWQSLPSAQRARAVSESARREAEPPAALAELSAQARRLREDVAFLSRVVRQLRDQAIAAGITRSKAAAPNP